MSLELDNPPVSVKWTESKPRKRADIVSKQSSLLKESTKLKRSPMGIVELDEMLRGGFPEDSVVLLSGNPGSGKTIFSAQFLYNGAVKYGEAGVCLSFAENRDEYYRNMLSLGMDMRKLERKRLFKLIDMVTMHGEDVLKIVTEKIMKTTIELKAKRLVVDSLSGLLLTLGVAEARTFLHTVLCKMTKSLGVTTLLIGEIPYGEYKTGYGVEEFVADGVIFLTHMDRTSSENRRFTIAKMRGTSLDRFSFEYLIGKKYGGIGPIILPKRAAISSAPTEKISSGVEGIDNMLYGGVFKRSVTLIEGASGSGKTIMCLQFVSANALKGEKAMLISLEEPTGQIKRTMTGIGLDPQKLKDNLILDSYVPETFTPLHYYMLIKDLLDLHRPAVLALDTITAMEHLLSKQDFIAFGRYLQLLSKQEGLTMFLTSTHGIAQSGRSSEFSTLADNIIILRYFEVKERTGREVLVRKTRGSGHEKKAMPFEITGSGINIQT